VAKKHLRKLYSKFSFHYIPSFFGALEWCIMFFMFLGVMLSLWPPLQANGSLGFQPASV
jgi:hypothetical protein